MNMRMKIIFISFIAIITQLSNESLGASDSFEQKKEIVSSDTTVFGPTDPIVEHIFYHLPLTYKRSDLRKCILTDPRFVLTDTSYNDFKPSSFFKGITLDKGVIEHTPDSIQILLIHGNAALITEKGGDADFKKHPMMLVFKYYYSYPDSVDAEYMRLISLIGPLYADQELIKEDTWETQYSSGDMTGTAKCIGKIFDHFEPYYRVSISQISFHPSIQNKVVYVLEIVFSKEDEESE